jgi:integrase
MEVLTAQLPEGLALGQWSVRTESAPRGNGRADSSRLDVQLVDGAVLRGGHQAWGDCVMILATTALRISEVAGLEVGDVDLARGLLNVRRQTYPGRVGLVTKETKAADGARYRSSTRCGKR